MRIPDALTESNSNRDSFAEDPDVWPGSREEYMSEKSTDSEPDRTKHPTGAEGEVELDPGDAHIGATEDQVSDTTAPAGEAFKDEPKQG